MSAYTLHRPTPTQRAALVLGCLLIALMTGCAGTKIIPSTQAVAPTGECSDAALTAADRLINSAPTNPAHFHARARIHVCRGDLARALADLNRTIELDQQRYDAFMERAAIYERSGKLPAAIADYTRSISLRPGEFDPYFRRGMIMKARGETDRMLEDMMSAAMTGRRDPRPHLIRARALLDQGRADTALADLDAVMDMESGNTEALTMRGYAHYALGQLSLAEEDWEDAIDEDEGMFKAWLGLGTVYLETARLAEAVDALGTALGLEAGDDGRVSALYNRGYAFYLLSMYEDASEDFSAAIGLAPGDHEVFILRAYAQYYLGHTAEALHDLDQALGLHPTGSRIYFDRGNIYLNTYDYTSAVDDFTSAITLDRAFYEAYMNRAKAYYEEGEARLALTDYDRAVALRPGDAAPYRNRSAALIALGRLEAARADLSKAYEMAPELKDVTTALAEISANLGAWQDACGWIEEALEREEADWEYLVTNPAFKTLRSQPCFIGLAAVVAPEGVAISEVSPPTPVEPKPTLPEVDFPIPGMAPTK